VSLEKEKTEDVSFKLNGRLIRIPKGWTVMQAAEREGVSIPHFCWHPHLSVAGVCRFCMVKVEGRPKLEMACNLTVTEGMEVSNKTAEVKEAYKWALEFHLLNHPLDCPICDQAGECGLQDSYMDVGKYSSQVSDYKKVLKPKALIVGSELVLDAERCILCSRCVRFEEEVTKTNILGIFNRGDRSMIGLSKDTKITHRYQENLVDICPVGAFTSRRFRFKQRVWFLEKKSSICPGCSTGCAVRVYRKIKDRQYYRMKPDYDKAQNWMCDEGRGLFEYLNSDNRLHNCLVRKGSELKVVSFEEGIDKLAQHCLSVNTDKINLILTPQYTSEEFDEVLTILSEKVGIKKIYIWRDPTESPDDFDGLLLRGDRNPNTRGLQILCRERKFSPQNINQLSESFSEEILTSIILGPENLSSAPSFSEQLSQIKAVPFVSLWTVSNTLASHPSVDLSIPLKGFAEKKGHFVNFSEEKRKLEDPFPCHIQEAKDIISILREFSKKLL